MLPSRPTSRATAHAIIFGAILLATLSLALSGAQATPPSSTLQQHWELLSEPVSTSSSQFTYSVSGVTLPGGTSAFDPQPTAEMDIVAKVGGATADGRWTVKLRDTVGQTLSQVEFGAADFNFTLRTGALDWPDTDLYLRDLRLEVVKSNPTDLTGTIDIRKATVKIHQTGRIKATVGRVRLAAFHDQITSATFTDLADGSRYEHVATDFVPAPVARLNLIAKATLGTGAIRLIDEVGEVAAETTLTQAGAADIPAFTLDGGRTYRLQARADANSLVRVYSADLVLEQSTTDDLGITATVGWYPSISLPVDATATATSAGQAFRAPEVDAFAHAGRWVSVAKTSTGQVTRVALQEAGGADVVETATSTVGYTLIEQPVANLTPGIVMDSRTRVTKPGGAALGIPGQTRVASSVLRLAAQLRDIAPPTLTAPFTSSLPRINPDPASPNPNKVTHLAATAMDDSFPLTWAIDVIPPGGGTPVAGSGGTLTTDTAPIGPDASLAWDWNGRSTIGALPVADGPYTVRLTVTDNWRNVTTSEVTVLVDTTPPTIANLTATPGVFDPASQTTQIGVDPFEQSAWFVEVRDPGDTTTIRRFPATGTASGTTLFDPVAPAQPLRWDGRNTAGSIMADDDYTVRLTLTDPTGNTSNNTASPLTVGVNRYAPTIGGVALSNAAFSPLLPAADPKSKTTLTASISENSAWTVSVSDRTFTGTGTAISAVWDGRNAAGLIVDGAYTFTVNATDIHQSTATPVTRAVTVDTVAPVIANLTATPGVFNPSTGTTQIGADPFEQSDWAVEIRDSANTTTLRRFPAAGTAAGTTLFDPAAPTQSLTWDGRGTAGAFVADADYKVRLVLTDPAGNPADNYAAPLVVGVNRLAPVIGGATLSNAAFNPTLPSGNAKGRTTLTASLSEPGTWTVGVSDRTFTGTGTAISVVWDGRNAAGLIVADGPYTFTVNATDIHGTAATPVTRTATVDTVAPVIANLAATPSVFNPSTETSQIGTDPFEQSTWVVSVRDLADTTTVRSYSGSGTGLYDPAAPTEPLRWDGRNTAGSLMPDANYKVRLLLTDPASNSADNYASPLTIGVNCCAPVITGAVLSNAAFNPTLPSSNPKSGTTLTATLSESSAWTVTVSDRTFTGTGTSISATWDGRNAAGQIVADGPYTFSVTATDIHGSAAVPVEMTTTIDAAGPSVTSVVPAGAARVSPNGDGTADAVTFGAQADEPASWRLAISSDSGVVRTILAPVSSSVSIVWDGKGEAGATLADGPYASTLTATDDAGNSTVVAPGVVTLDTGAPTIAELTVSPTPFSPNADGVRDLVVVSATVADPWGPVDWTVSIATTQGDPLWSYTGTGGQVSVSWDGRDEDAFTVPDGVYVVAVSASDNGDNKSEQMTENLSVDATAPDISDLVPSSESVYRAQPLLARVADPNIVASSIALTLLDESTQQALSPPVAYSAVTGIARTPAVSLVSGRWYRLTARAADIAGSQSTAESRFLATTLTIEPATAEIPRTACSVGATSGAGTRTATCAQIPVQFHPTTVSVDGLGQSGTGVILESVSFGGAVAGTTLAAGATIEVPTTLDAGVSIAPPLVQPMYFTVPTAPDHLSTYPVASLTGQLAQVSFQVPATWETAYVRMDRTATTTIASTCADPTAAAEPGHCSPSPIFDGISFWMLPNDSAHLRTCDGALAHRERLVVQPGSPLTLSVDVANTPTFTGVQAQLVYSVNHGPPRSRPGSASASGGYDFVISGDELGEGGVLRYGFIVHGAFGAGPCLSRDTAIAPYMGSFVSYVSGDSSSPAASVALEEAMAVAATIEPTKPRPQLCVEFFAPPTPCGSMSGATESNASTGAAPAIVTRSDDKKSCIYRHNGVFPWAWWTEKVDGGATAEGTPRMWDDSVPPILLTERTAVVQRATADSISLIPFTGKNEITSHHQVSYDFAWPVGQPEVPVILRHGYELRGEGRVYSASVCILNGFPFLGDLICGTVASANSAWSETLEGYTVEGPSSGGTGTVVEGHQVWEGSNATPLNGGVFIYDTPTGIHQTSGANPYKGSFTLKASKVYQSSMELITRVFAKASGPSRATASVEHWDLDDPSVGYHWFSQPYLSLQRQDNGEWSSCPAAV